MVVHFQFIYFLRLLILRTCSIESSILHFLVAGYIGSNLVKPVFQRQSPPKEGGTYNTVEAEAEEEEEA